MSRQYIRFNLIIEMLFISILSQPLLSSGPSFLSFNLIIEMLFISIVDNLRRPTWTKLRFNLIIEMLFISIRRINPIRSGVDKFQSHNWDAFHFNYLHRFRCSFRVSRFNLIIEMLFISIRGLCKVYHLRWVLFQSHNWDAFHFNVGWSHKYGGGQQWYVSIS